jgi:structural maintenance of chromosomes protein 6
VVPSPLAPKRTVLTKFRLYTILQAKIETTALAANVGEARDMLKIWGVTSSVCLDGTKVVQKRKTVTTEPPFRAPWGPRLSQGTPAQNINAVKESKAAAERELREAMNDLRQAEVACAAAEAEAKRCRQVAAQAKTATFRARNEIRIVESQKPMEVAATQAAAEDGDLQAQICEAAEAAAEAMAHARETQISLKDAEAEMARVVELVAAQRERIQRLEEENAEFIASMRGDGERLAEEEAELANYVEMRERLLGALDEQKQKAASYEESLPVLEAKACDACPRDEVAATRAALGASLRANKVSDADIERLLASSDLLGKRAEALLRKITAAERDAGGSLPDLRARLGELDSFMEGAGGRRMRSASGLYRELRAAHRDRKRKLNDIDKDVERIVSARFKEHMRRRGFLGRMSIDRQAGKLELKVEVTGAAGANKVKDLKQLSGGERSFTTVAFTLALGGETSMPFRAMDEFDVFMVGDLQLFSSPCFSFISTIYTLLL